MKKVLIITYYWPPTGGAGVQRWLKFSKYFRKFGWEPIIYTPSNPDFPINDDTLLKDIPADLTVLKTQITEPYDIYRKIMRKKKTETVNQGFLSEGKENTLLQSAMIWVRGNFFIPDARKFWIKPSISYLAEYIKQHKIDAVISTGPPHSMHLIAMGLKQKFNIPWIADFRDPWTQIDFYSQLKLSSYADNKHKKLERQVLTQANKVVTVSPTCGTDLEKLGNRKVDVITNGFDTDDFKFSSDLKQLDGFLFHHIGALNKDRNPYTLWKVLGDLCKEHADLKKDLVIKFTGKTDAIAFETLKQNGILDNAQKTDYLPHSEVVKLMAQSPVLLLPLNNTPNNAGVLSGKLFEYLAAKRPIFGIGLPDADAAAILKSTQAGTMVHFDDYEGTKKAVLDLYQKYKLNQLSISSSSIDKYSRENCAKDYANLLNEISK
ncbi:MAG: glycosyltransferase [Bacteroidetes bacterium]|nr:glycosyltransferase [Bacteroidota bacterium]